MNQKKDFTYYIKNPIGLIGLFLVLVEALASIVVISSSLSEKLNLILVLFIVIFPCMVLCIFYLLVTKHHKKLYSPSDYKDENNFVLTYDSARQTVVKTTTEHKQSAPTMINSGMNVKDVEFIKEMLQQVLTLQKESFTQRATNNKVGETERTIEEKLDAYAKEIYQEEMENYSVQISLMDKSTDLCNTLRQRGYKTKIYMFNKDDVQINAPQEHEAIWVGNKVPTAMVVDVIKTARSVYPHLKYILLSGDDEAPPQVDYEIFIGGSSETARKKGLKKLDTQDFEELYAIKNKEQLHRFVKSFC